MTLRKKTYLCAFVLISIISIARANTTFTLNCPKEITISEKLTTTYPQWREFLPVVKHYLSGIELYDSDPENLMSLKPDVMSDQKSVWRLEPERSVYVVCRYNATGVQLTQTLPPNITSCTVDYDTHIKGDNGFVPMKMSCR